MSILVTNSKSHRWMIALLTLPASCGTIYSQPVKTRSGRQYVGSAVVSSNSNDATNEQTCRISRGRQQSVTHQQERCDGATSLGCPSSDRI